MQERRGRRERCKVCLCGKGGQPGLRAAGTPGGSRVCARYRTGLCPVQGGSGEGIRRDSALTLEALKLLLQPNGQGPGQGLLRGPAEAAPLQTPRTLSGPRPGGRGLRGSRTFENCFHPGSHPPRGALFLRGDSPDLGVPASPTGAGGGGGPGGPLGSTLSSSQSFLALSAQDSL